MSTIGAIGDAGACGGEAPCDSNGGAEHRAGVNARPYDASCLCFHGGIHVGSLGVAFMFISVIETDHA